MSVALKEWIDLLRSEYLEEFIASGGAAVKIAVVPSDQTSTVLNALKAIATEQGYFAASVDAAQTRIHMIDQIFYVVARQLDWDVAIDRCLRGIFQENGILVKEDSPLYDMDALAEVNGQLKPALYGHINRLITNSVLKNYRLCKEFRTAIAMLCWSYVNPQNVSPSDADTIKQWLLGEKCSLAALKRLQIFQRIGRHNARLLLIALALWLREIGYAGMVLLLDLNAVVTAYAPDEMFVRYSRSAILDTYEVLRQFIDDTDEVSHLLVAVAAGPALLDDPRRSVDNYTALKLRIMDEVRDRNRANPLNAMVRLDVER